MSNKTDIIIPLGNGSKSNNDELKILLRSIEKYATGYDNILIITSCPPNWLKEDEHLHVLYKEDSFKTNKDANLFEKVKFAMEKSNADDIIFSADDCAILMPINFSWLPPIYNVRNIEFYNRENNSKWQKRMLATLKEINLIDGNWDSHTPQKWNIKEVLKIIQDIPYTEPEGRCINSSIMGRIYNSKIPPFAIAQQTVKETAEDLDISDIKFDKVFIGYNDSAFLNGLREKLFHIFPIPCQWEKSYINQLNNQKIEIGIIHYNTPELTEATIKSINKHTTNSHITILDNSTINPFIAKFDNVTILDNTTGKFIDFEKFKNLFPNKPPSDGNDYGSAKHCYSIQFLIDYINKPFILVESDILLTNDISCFQDLSKIFVGSIQTQHKKGFYIKRIKPFLCFINVQLMRENNVIFFNPEKMWDLTTILPNRVYDTGAAFFEQCINLNLPYKEIDINKYMVHLGHGSWYKKDAKKWISKFKYLWN